MKLKASLDSAEVSAGAVAKADQNTKQELCRPGQSASLSSGPGKTCSVVFVPCLTSYRSVFFLFLDGLQENIGSC